MKQLQHPQLNVNIENLFHLPGWYIYWKDIQGHYMSCNDAMAAINNFSSPQDIAGRCDYDLPLISALTAELFREDDKKVIASGSAMQFQELAVFGKHEILFFSIKTLLYNQNKKIVGILGMSCEQGIFDSQAHYPALYNRHVSSSASTLSLLARETHFSECEKKHGLSRRQSECLYYLTRGMTMKQIAKVLNVSPRTIEHHVENLKVKLDCYSRSALVAKAMQNSPA